MSHVDVDFRRGFSGVILAPKGHLTDQQESWAPHVVRRIGCCVVVVGGGVRSLQLSQGGAMRLSEALIARDFKAIRASPTRL